MKINKHNLYFILIFATILFSNANYYSNASNDDDEFFTEIVKTKQEDKDFVEKSNRIAFNFNKKIYNKIFIPINNVYNKLPIEIRWTYKNFVQNYTETPKDIVLSAFDFDLEAMVVSGWRFAINTIFGLFGLFDIANTLDLPSYHKTLSDIAHFYHIPTGPYIVLPFFGSNTMIGMFMDIVDFTIFNPWFWPFIFQPIGYIFSFQNYLNPFLFINYQSSSLLYASIGMSIGNYIHLMNSNLNEISNVFENSIDPYISMKYNYLQNLKKHFEKYDDIRYNGQIRNENICDYDAMVFLPDECNEDEKEYGIVMQKLYFNFL